MNAFNFVMIVACLLLLVEVVCNQVELDRRAKADKRRKQRQLEILEINSEQ